MTLGPRRVAVKEPKGKAGGEAASEPRAEPYDALVARLEKVVAELEKGELSLEDALERFAEGVKLAREAGKKLDEAEKRIERLVKNADGEVGAEPFDPDRPDAKGT
jgi:exodeoxyribonuclease VII small subunit